MPPTGDNHLTQELLSILSYLSQRRPLRTCRHSQVGHREIKSPVSSLSPFPAPTSLRSLQESGDTAPSMEPSTLEIFGHVARELAALSKL